MANRKKCLICAHRGLSGLVPENTMAAFAAAQILGADEIEFDVRLCGDGKMIVSHDAKVDRISNRKGLLTDYKLDTLLKTNAGAYMNWQTYYCTPEQVISHFGGYITLNIHINEEGKNGSVIKELRRLIHYYDILDNVYFSASGEILEMCRQLAPEIPRCCVDTEGSLDFTAIDFAIKCACNRVQFYKPNFNQKMVDYAHEYGINVGVYWADDLYETRRFLDMNIDTVMTHRADILIAMPMEK